MQGGVCMMHLALRWLFRVALNRQELISRGEAFRRVAPVNTNRLAPHHQHFRYFLRRAVEITQAGPPNVCWEMLFIRILFIDFEK